jgi:hypothetical protein
MKGEEDLRLSMPLPGAFPQHITFRSKGVSLVNLPRIPCTRLWRQSRSPPFVEIDIDYAWFFTSSQQAKESPCIMAPTTEKE